MTKLDIGIVGLSVMGRSLALNMADHGFKVGGYNRSAAVTEQVMKEHPHQNLTPFYDLNGLIASLSRPRKVMLMIQAGKPVDAVIEQLIPLLEQGDIILAFGNNIRLEHGSIGNRILSEFSADIINSGFKLFLFFAAHGRCVKKGNLAALSALREPRGRKGNEADRFFHIPRLGNDLHSRFREVLCKVDRTRQGFLA